jgi:hypothetical protein
MVNIWLNYTALKLPYFSCSSGGGPGNRLCFGFLIRLSENGHSTDMSFATNFWSSQEYIQELEARLRQYELQGIIASSEIHLAARGVVDENKKLRRLLAKHKPGHAHRRQWG